jgi:hypothetical protein
MTQVTPERPIAHDIGRASYVMIAGHAAMAQ